MKKMIIISIFFMIYFITKAISIYAIEFNNLSLTDKELNQDIERAYSMGILEGFSGIKPYSKAELIKVYSVMKDEIDINKYIEKDVESLSKFFIEPLSDTKIRLYYFNTNVPEKERYCIENMEGSCLDKGLTSFINFTGQGRINENIVFFYEGQVQASGEVKEATLKKAYIKLRTGKIAWEFGRDTLWIGHGYHGSFLLSNNAEPFLLFKFDTEEPFRLPFFLSKIGEFKYTLFHGWLDNFNILGHRLSYKPIPLVEIGANQTAVYRTNKGYKITDWPHILFSSEENVPGAYYNTDQRGSLDIALYMPFLSKIPPLKGGKIYAEYGGEDTFAWWQKEDKTWYGPLGFEFLGQGIMLGLFVTTGQTDLRVEYSENYRSYPLFFDWYKKHGINYASKGERWYRDIGFLNDNVIMGHHMGPEAEDLFFELRHRLKNFTIVGFYDRERHHLYKKVDQYHIYKTTPEIRNQYGLEVIFQGWKQFELSSQIIYNRYKNVDTDPAPLNINIYEGRSASELITGFSVSYLW